MHQETRPQYYSCPDCGAHLDPGERCDCDASTQDAPYPIPEPAEPRRSFPIIKQSNPRKPPAPWPRRDLCRPNRPPPTRAR